MPRSPRPRVAPRPRLPAPAGRFRRRGSRARLRLLRGRGRWCLPLPRPHRRMPAPTRCRERYPRGPHGRPSDPVRRSRWRAVPGPFHVPDLNLPMFPAPGRCPRPRRPHPGPARTACRLRPGANTSRRAGPGSGRGIPPPTAPFGNLQGARAPPPRETCRCRKVAPPGFRRLPPPRLPRPVRPRQRSMCPGRILTPLHLPGGSCRATTRLLPRSRGRRFRRGTCAPLRCLPSRTIANGRGHRRRPSTRPVPTDMPQAPARMQVPCSRAAVTRPPAPRQAVFRCLAGPGRHLRTRGRATQAR